MTDQAPDSGAPTPPKRRYTNVGPSRPCEVCGLEDRGCKFRSDGAWWCQWEKIGTEGFNPPAGWTYIQGPRPASVGSLLAPNVGGMPANIAAYGGVDGDEEAYKQASEKRAREWWKQCFKNTNHERVRAYLAARGIPLERLPRGEVPKVLAFHPKIPNDIKVVDPHARGGYRWLCEPAMVASVCEIRADDHGRRFFVTGVHRTFLDPTRPMKRREIDEGPGSEFGKAKKMKGRCNGRAVFLGGSLDDGVMQLGEGLETCLWGLAATGRYTVAALSAQGMLAWRVPAGMVERAGKVHTIVILADLDRSRLGRGRQEDWVVELTRDFKVNREEAQRIAALPTGEAYAWRWAAQTIHEHPWLNVIVQAPGLKHCDVMVVKDPKHDHVKALEGKGVDWDDVGRKLGIEVVAAALNDGVDPESARAIAAAWTGDEPPSDADHDGPPEGYADEGIDQGASVGPALGDGDDRGTRAGPALNSLGSGEDDPQPEINHPEVPWVVGRGKLMPVIEESPASRARRFLWERMRLPGHQRFMLARWGAKWWVWQDGVYREIAEELLQSVVWAWLEGFRHEHRGDYKRLSPTSRMVKEVMAALAIDTAVHGVSLPVWAARTIDVKGAPLWGKASSIREMMRVVNGRAELASRSVDLVVASNGMVDVAEVARTGRVRLMPHTPEFVNTSRLPYEIDVASLQSLIAGGDEDKIYTRICPKFWGWLCDAASIDPVRMEQLQLMMGDTRSNDRSIEKVYAVPGVQRGGKGIIEDAMTIIMGEDNVEATSLDSLEDRDGTASLVNKAVATMSDAHLASFNQGGKAKEMLKVISGRGFVRIRDLYSPAYTVKLKCRVWMFFNEEPDLRDESGALTDRFVFWPITKSYIGREDPSIKDGLKAESAGLLVWAIMGAVKLARMKRRQIVLCDASKAATEEFEEVASHVRVFVREMLDVHAKGTSLTPETLYDVYRRYCHHVLKRKPLGQQKFRRVVKLHIPNYAYTQPRSAGRKRLIENVGLTSEAAALPLLAGESSDGTLHADIDDLPT